MYYRKTVEILTKKDETVNITENIREIIKDSGIRNGLLLIEVPHSTVGIMTTTGHCPEVMEDLRQDLDRIVPSRSDFVHEESPKDASGHIKCALFGTSVSAIVENEDLLSYDRIAYFIIEYDGPRHRKYHVAIVGE